MAKKKNAPKQRKKLPNVAENVLPQNILHVGEHVEEDTNIYISQNAYKQIHKFTKNKTTNESGGVLVGTVVNALGKTNLLIENFVEAKFCEATPTTLTFTHATWEYIHKEIDKKHHGKKILGWIHTHPNFGIFLSEYDKFIQQNFFSDPTQVAYVVDPIQNIEGFYFWINEKLEKCKGFYIYDKVGTQIKVTATANEDNKSERKPASGLQSILLLLVSLFVIIQFFMNMSLRSELEQLKSQQQTITNNAAAMIHQLQQRVKALEDDLKSLSDSMDNQTEPTEPNSSTNPTEGDGSDE